MSTQAWLWITFGLGVFALLALDLGVFQRKAHEVKVKEAMVWSVIWIALALVFNAGIYFTRGSDAALKFLAGYILEKSLSVDNLFVFLLIFRYFHVPKTYQHKVLFWGIAGALIMRALFIAGGIVLLHYFEWIIYIFGAFLVFTGIKLWAEKDKEIHPEKNPVLILFRRLMPVTQSFEKEKFLVKRDNRFYATPLLIVLLVVESTDVIFAIDSIPAVLAITTDPFIVYTSNVFAILGLRALYFALAGMMELFHHLHYGLAAILILVGIKMLISHYYKVPTGIALGTIGAILGISIIASILWPKIEAKSS